PGEHHFRDRVQRVVTVRLATAIRKRRIRMPFCAPLRPCGCVPVHDRHAASTLSAQPQRHAGDQNQRQMAERSGI
ncbi:hypothetical protein RCN84_17420, partial [Escherichia marmotae]|nr:hypothetical protein [Escherichia marmotae]